MIGLFGKPFSDEFRVKWSRSAKELKKAGADRVLSDSEARKIGIVVKAARSLVVSKK